MKNIFDGKTRANKCDCLHNILQARNQAENGYGYILFCSCVATASPDPPSEIIGKYHKNIFDVKHVQTGHRLYKTLQTRNQAIQ